MRIISKFKDYYDHEVGYYGYDPTVVYERRLSSNTHIGSENLTLIAGRLYASVRKDGKFYFTENKVLSYQQNQFISSHRHGQSDLNVTIGQPVLSVYSYYGQNGEEQYGHDGVPLLSSLGFPSIIDSREMYRMIYDWLSAQKDKPYQDTRTDKEKVISHGFDKKKSFRPKMK